MSVFLGEDQIPLVDDILSGSQNIEVFGFSNLTFLIYISAILYVSPILSGILLILQKKAGIIISYVQTPFRLFLIIQPSIFFILWPLNESLSQSTALWLGFSLVFISEIVKISTLAVWNKQRAA